MTNMDYLEGCRRTWSPVNNDDVLHCIMGLSTESNELLDNLKKHMFYGRELDMQNIKEELGDIEFYLSILYDTIGYSQSEARRDNQMKLKKRYPDKFKDVVVRDVDTELSHIG